VTFIFNYSSPIYYLGTPLLKQGDIIVIVIF